MPIVGSLDVSPLVAGAATIGAFASEPLVLERARLLQVMYEIDAGCMAELLPPALHPTVPPTVTTTFWQVAGGPFGPFALAQVRIGCRAGVRPRGYAVASFTNQPAVAERLAGGWGYGCTLADVAVKSYHDRVAGSVDVDGVRLLEASLTDPEPISGADVFLSATMQLARTPVGPKLVQVDPELTIHKADRGRPAIETFRAGELGDARVAPVFPVSAVALVADLSLLPVRYVCDPNMPALRGTQAVGGADNE